jgi:hypothetical protein
MIYFEVLIPEKVGYVLPIGDLHFSDKSFREQSYKKLTGYIDWVKKNPNARVVLGGDMFNVATRGSKTSPFDQRMSVNDEMKEIVRLLEPIKKQIVGAIDGNHEHRAEDFLDLSLTETLCGKLDIPYLGISGVINFKVGKKGSKTGGQWQQSYQIYFHHTTGGGASIGGGLNRVEKLGNIVEGADCYCGFHNHKLSMSKSTIFKPNPNSKKVEERVITHLTCGGYLQYNDSYAERGMLRPTKLGSPRIRLDGTKKDLHISI